jgi:hypothetical protein
MDRNVSRSLLRVAMADERALHREETRSERCPTRSERACSIRRTVPTWMNLEPRWSSWQTQPEWRLDSRMHG